VETHVLNSTPQAPSHSSCASTSHTHSSARSRSPRTLTRPSGSGRGSSTPASARASAGAAAGASLSRPRQSRTSPSTAGHSHSSRRQTGHVRPRAHRSQHGLLPRAPDPARAQQPEFRRAPDRVRAQPEFLGASLSLIDSARRLASPVRLSSVRAPRRRLVLDSDRDGDDAPDADRSLV
jgi:hypothetical protein